MCSVGCLKIFANVMQNSHRGQKAGTFDSNANKKSAKQNTGNGRTCRKE